MIVEQCIKGLKAVVESEKLWITDATNTNVDLRIDLDQAPDMKI